MKDGWGYDPFFAPLYRSDLPGGRIYLVNLRWHQIDCRQQAVSHQRANVVGADQCRQPREDRADHPILCRRVPVGSAYCHDPCGAELGPARRPRDLFSFARSEEKAADRVRTAVTAEWLAPA